MRRFLPATIFGIAFGVLEAIVVVYLRKIYYPEGFTFPLKILEPQMIQVEIIREFSTIIMLATIGWILGKKFGERFSFFIFTFGIWDIFYYVGLKIFLNWPESLFTWDVLFLIPITWIGPVLAPLICSSGMILIALVYIKLTEKEYMPKFNLLQIALIVLGVVIIIYTFIYDYLTLLIEHNLWKNFPQLTDKIEFWNAVKNHIPKKFNWTLFTLGCALIGVGYIWSFLNSVKLKE